MSSHIVSASWKHPKPISRNSWNRWLEDLGNTVDGLYIVDSDQRIVTWNQGAERILGYSQADVLNKRCYQVISSRLRNGKLLCQPNCLVSRCVQRGALPSSLSACTRTKEGKEVSLNISVIVVPRGRRSLTVHLMRDATSDERLQQTMGQFLQILSASGLLQRNGLAPSQPPAQGQQELTDLLHNLTRRQVEVLELLAAGLSSQAIAGRLGISLCTVRNHVQNLRTRLGLHSRSQMVSYAFRVGLL